MVALVSDAPPLGGELERVADHALDAARVKTLVSMPDLGVEAAVRASADAGVLALGVLAHEEHVDVRRAPAGERAGNPREEPRRPQVRPQVESAGASRRINPHSAT